MEIRKMADYIRDQCIEAARDGFRDASISGLCAEGAMEAAISAMQSLDVDKLIKESEQNED
ncbi:acetyltransferase [Rhodohalobacter barkolensis]|uniref:Acetyltransferase n=1 Tax=Rhodohalobacter barkolensis TaxID=2053187 RepID=A0A2N0VME0_9BACT|nr:acetyltransferase [Rhodohalobacter barkolensis]